MLSMKTSKIQILSPSRRPKGPQLSLERERERERAFIMGSLKWQQPYMEIFFFKEKKKNTHICFPTH